MDRLDYAIRWSDESGCHVLGPYRTETVACAAARARAEEAGREVEVLLDDGTPIAVVREGESFEGGVQ